jgi:hypothetical protein
LQFIEKQTQCPVKKQQFAAKPKVQSQKPLFNKSKVSTSTNWTGSSVNADHRCSQSSHQDDEKNGAIFASALIQQLEQNQSKAQK